MQTKDVINEDGIRLGNITDIEVDENGNIIWIIIYDKKGIFRNFSKEEVRIKWSNIKKVGEDVILVNKKG